MKKQNTKHNKKQVTILSTLSAEASHLKVSVTRHVKPSVQISYRAPLQNKQPQPQNEGSMLPSFVDETQADNDRIELDRRRRKQNRIVKTINKSKQTSNSQNPKLKKGLPTTTDVHKVTTINAEEKSSKNLFRILDVQASSANYFTKIHNIKERPQSSDRRTHLEPDNTVPPGQLLEHVIEMQQHKNVPSKQYNVSRYTNNINNTHLKNNEARIKKQTHTPRSATQEKFTPRRKDSNGNLSKFYDVNKYMERHVLERDDFKGEPAQELTDIKMYSSNGVSSNVEQRMKIVNEIQSEIMRWRKEFKAPRFFENICSRHDGNASIEETGDKLHPHPGQGLVPPPRLEENKHVEPSQQSRTTDRSDAVIQTSPHFSRDAEPGTSPPSFPEKECVPSPSPTKPDSLLDNYLNTDSMVFKLSLPSPELDKAEEVLLNTDRLLRYTRQQLLDVQSNAELQDFAGGGSQAVLVNRENSRIYAQQLVDAKMQNLVNDWTIRTQGFTQNRETAHCRNSVVRKKHNTPVGSSSNMFHPLISTPSRHMNSSRVSEEGPVQVPNKTAQGFSEKMGLFTSSSTILGEKHGRLSPEINIGQCGKTTETVLRASPHTANRKYSPKRLSKVKPRKVQKVPSPPIKQSISDIARPSSTHSADITKLYHHLNGLRQRRSPERRMSNLKSREEKGRDDVSICSVCRCENSGNLNDVSVQSPPKDMKVQVNPPNSVIVKVVAKETKGITQNDTPPAWLNRLQIQELPSLTIKRGLTVHKPLIFHIPPAGVNLISAPRDNIGLRDFSHRQVQIEEEEQWQKPTMNKPTRGRNLDNMEASTVDIKREPICLCKDRRKEKLLKDGKFELALNQTENLHDKYSLNTGAKPKNFAQTPTEISDTIRHEKISKQKKGVRFETEEKEAYHTPHYSLKRAVLSPRKDTANGSSSNDSSTNLGYNPDSSISLSSIQSPSIDSARNGLRSAIKFLESKSESGPYKNRESRIDELNEHIPLGIRRDELASSIPVTASRVNTNNGPHTEATKAWPEEHRVPPDVMASATIALHQKLLDRNTLRETTSERSLALQSDGSVPLVSTKSDLPVVFDKKEEEEHLMKESEDNVTKISKEEVLKELQALEADKRSSHHELDQYNQPLVNKEIENYKVYEKMSQAETQDSEEGNDQERVDEEPEYEDDWDEDVEENTNTKEKTSNSSTSIPGTPDEGHVVNESSRSPHRINSQTSPSRLILTAPIKPVRSLSPRDHSDSFPPSEERILSVHSISSAPSVHTSPSHHSVHAQISFDVPVCAALANSPVTSTVTIHKPYFTSSYQQTCHEPKTASLSSQSTQTHTSTRVSNFEITPLLLDKASEINSTLFEKRPGSSLFQGTSLPVTTFDNNLASAPPLSEEVEPSIPPLSLEAGASVHQTPRLCCATKHSIITSEPSTITVTSGFNTTTPALDHNQTGAPSHQRFPSADLSNYPSLHNFANYHPYGWVSVDNAHYTVQPTPMIPTLSGHVPLLPYGAVPTPILMDHPVEYRLVSTEQDVSGPSRNPRLSPSSPRPHRQSPQHKKNNKTMRDKPEPVDLSSSDSANVHESNQTQQKTKHRSTQQATFKANDNSGVCDEVKRFREKVLMAAKNKYLKKSKQAVWPKSRPNPIVEVTSESSLEFKLKKNIPKYSMSSSSDSRTESITATDVTPSISDLSEGEVHPGVHGKRPLLTYRSDHSLGEVPHCDCSLGEVEGCKHYQGGDYLSLGEVGHHPPGINGLRCVPDIPVYTSASLEGGHSDVTLRSSLPELLSSNSSSYNEPQVDVVFRSTRDYFNR